jgi:glutamate N-acetyltransferase/amino-acid N-acetyltransferase
MHGNDPNWGRVVSAAGRSGAKVIESKLDAYLNQICVMRQGHPMPFDKQQASASLDNKEVLLRVNLNLGPGRAIAWGCDLSAEYVNINSAYTT